MRKAKDIYEENACGMWTDAVSFYKNHPDEGSGCFYRDNGVCRGCPVCMFDDDEQDENAEEEKAYEAEFENSEAHRLWKSLDKQVFEFAKTRHGAEADDIADLCTEFLYDSYYEEDLSKMRSIERAIKAAFAYYASRPSAFILAVRPSRVSRSKWKCHG